MVLLVISQRKAELRTESLLCLLPQQHDGQQRIENQVRRPSVYIQQGRRTGDSPILDQTEDAYGNGSNWL